MPDVLHVGTYLVRASGLQDALHERGVAKALQHLVVCDSRFADTRLRVEDLHAQPVFGVAPDVALDAALVFDEVSPDECVVGAVRRLVEKLLAQCRLGLRCLGHHEQTTRVFVDTVHQSHFRIVGVEGGHIAHVPGYGVDQRAREVAGSRMHHHTGRFVDHHQIIVLVDNVQRDVLRDDAGVVLGMVEHECDDIARPYLVIAFDGFASHADVSCVGCCLYAVAAGVLHVLGEKLVNAYGCLSGVHHDAPVLVAVVIGIGLVAAAIVTGLFQLVVQQVREYVVFCHVYLCYCSPSTHRRTIPSRWVSLPYCCSRSGPVG